MWLVWSTMMMKSVMAGEYTAPPAQGPMMAEICGTTPEASVLRRKISAYPPRLGHAFLDARAAAVVEPDHRRAVLARPGPSVGRSCRVGLAQRAAEHGEVLRERVGEAAVDRAVARTPRRRRRPCSRPCPKSVQRWVTNTPSSWNVAGSKRRLIRSRAVSRPDCVDLGDAVLAAAGMGRHSHLLEFFELVVGFGHSDRPWLVVWDGGV